MTDRELFQQALEALEKDCNWRVRGDAAAALRERLAISYVPKVWMQCPECGKKSPMPDPDHKEWQGLTDQEIDALQTDWVENGMPGSREFARAIEQRLKEKNA